MDRTIPTLLLSLAAIALLQVSMNAVLGAEEAEAKKEAAEKKDGGEKGKADAKKPVPIDVSGWESEDEKYTNPVKTEVVEEGEQKQLKITYKGGETDKAVVCKAVDKLKLPGKAILHLRALNPGKKAVQVTVALKTGKTWVFHESQRIEVASSKEKFVDVAIDLTSSTFKSEATKWKNTGTLADPGQIKSLQLAVYNGKDDGTLMVTGIEVAPKP